VAPTLVTPLASLVSCVVCNLCTGCESWRWWWWWWWCGCVYVLQAKDLGRKAVSASGSVHNEEFSRKLVEFLKVCENIDTSLHW